jgi:hypothetical protein
MVVDIAAKDSGTCEIGELLSSLEMKNPIEEAEAAYSKGQFIYLGVMGFALDVRGVEANPYCLKDTGKLAVIPDTTDGPCSEEHMRLQDVARIFTEKYNTKLTELSNGEIIGNCGV